MRTILVLILMIICASTSFALVGTRVDGVKLMNGPGYDNKQVMDFPENTPLKVLAKAGEWWQVKDYWGAKGWVDKTLLNNKRMGVVMRSKATLRSGPSTRYSKLRTLIQGYAVEIVQSKGRWYKIIVVDPSEGWEGWIHQSLIWG
ncbi:MAG: SH3 domain-containing protein [Candidatus Margulisbacteria bacterium]|nr:SH3 domain-containing protein [Candidatus Margulisiibacteriota bacterium]